MFHPGKLLVVDDEHGVRTSLREILEQEGHEVTTAASGQEALVALGREPFDLILVDLKMEGMDGLEVMTEAKRMMPDTVVIMLTAYGTLDSAVGALREGAHDYLVKPCSVEEIVASVETGLAKRQQAMHRRELVTDIENSVRQLRTSSVPPRPHAQGPSLGRYVRTRHLVLDREKQIVVAGGQPLSLTPTEFKLLACLMDNVNRTLGFGEMAREALDYQCTDQEARRALKTHFWRLRKKLRSSTGDDSFIVNVRGKGYMLKP
ncbi:MAG TPA: response regulator transcription factor [Anaerolineae bacterium]|nr:response regulator transcription factor [Anaerolineae bacterium]